MMKEVLVVVLLAALTCVVFCEKVDVENEDDTELFEEPTLLELSKRYDFMDDELIDEYCRPYRTGVRRGKVRCGKDARPHCLLNGSVVLGSCRIKRAVCVEGALEDFSWRACAIP